jgi:large subunit ribosomal protein L25
MGYNTREYWKKEETTMERVQMKATARPVSTKGELTKLRSAGMVPGVVYGKKTDAVTVSVSAKDVLAVLQSPSGANTLVDLDVGGNKDTVMIKELTREILLSERLRHVDFLRISLKDKLEVQVPLVLTGDPAGAADGGVVQQVLREVSLKVLPTEIPESIMLDISTLGVGESLSAAELLIPAGAELLTDPAEAVVTIAAPRAAEEETTEEAGAADEAAQAEAAEEEAAE